MALTTESALRKDRNTGKATLEHRHFATIAAIIRDMHGLDENDRKHVAFRFADELRTTNPKFDTKRFLAACGV